MVKHEPLVSVVIPVYNAEKYIKEAVSSALDQTYKNLEVVVVDDGSTDTTPTILAEMRRLDSRIRIHTQQNSGICVSLNRCLSESNGRYIARMDADDVMHPSRIEKQVQFMNEHPDVGVTSCLAHYIDEKGRIIGKNYTDLLSVDDCLRYMKENRPLFCLHPGAMFRSEAVEATGGYREDLPSAEDIDLWNRMAEAGFYLVVIPEFLMKYRIHSSSIMGSKHRLAEKCLDYVVDSMKLRRAGRPERTFEEYCKFAHTTSILNRLKRERYTLGSYHYRKAGLLFAQRKIVKFALHIILAGIFRPIYVARKLVKQRYTDSA